jgi:hypothetical protein
MKYTIAGWVGRLMLLVLAAFLPLGCGSDDKEGGFAETDDYTPYESAPDDSVIITGEANYAGPTDVIPEEGTITVGGEQIDVSDAQFCNDPDAKMDVITVAGEVVDVICYPAPTEENITEVAATSGETELPQKANNTVLVFDENTDGEPVVGDVSVDGNNVAIYGNGPENTVIDGDLVISGNNARVRGVRVTGDVILDLNNVALIFCVVEGNVVVRQNNVTVAATDVYGNMEVEGNNAILVQNHVQREWKIGGQAEFCDGNTAFDDEDDSLTVEEQEISDALTCGK